MATAACVNRATPETTVKLVSALIKKKNEFICNAISYWFSPHHLATMSVSGFVALFWNVAIWSTAISRYLHIDVYILLNLRSPSVYMGSLAPVVHVLDRKLLERLMSPSPKSQVLFASAFSWISDCVRIFVIHIFQVMASLLNLV